MSPDVSRRLGLVLGRHWVSPDERGRIISAALDADTWTDIPGDIRDLLADIGKRGAVSDTSRSTTPDAGDDDPDDEMLRAMAADGDEFQAYWTRGKGLARWSTKPHPWRTLRRLLRKHPGIRDAEGLASHYFHVVFGIWPGERKGDNPVGPG